MCNLLSCACSKKKTKRKKPKETKKGIDEEESKLTSEEISTKKEEQIITTPKLTEAERKFRERKIQKEKDRIMTKASKTHKEKVEELNAYLDKLSEHYDIPKVSWTK